MDPEQTFEFIMTVYKDQEDALKHIGDAVMSRVNTFLTIVSALLGFVLFVAKETMFADKLVNCISCAVMGLVLGVGFLTHAEITQWVMATVTARGLLDRVQRHFVEQSPELAPFCLNLRGETSYLRYRKTLKEKIRTHLGPKQVVTLLNNSLACAIAGILSVTVLGQTYHVIGLSAIAFLAMWLIQYQYSRMRYRLEEEKQALQSRPKSHDTVIGSQEG